MSAEVPFFDEESMRKLARDHERLARQVQNLVHSRPTRNWENSPGRTVRTGITATNRTHPNYPDPPANTFVVRFTDTKVEPTPGVNVVERRPWEEKYVIARTVSGAWIAKDTPVTLVKVSGIGGTQWIIIEGPAEFITFELLEHRWGKSEAGVKAKILAWWGSVEDCKPEAISTTKLNAADDFKVWFRQQFFPRALFGATGVAVHDAKLHRYWVVQCDQMTTRVTGETTAAVCPGSDFALRSAQACDFWPNSQLPPTGNSIPLVRNYYQLACLGSSNAHVEWVEDGEYWIGVQLQHEQTDVVVDIRYKNGYNSATGQVECKIEKGLLKKCAIMRCTDTVVWETAIPLYRNVFLTDLRQQHNQGEGSDPDTCILQAKENSICGFEDLEGKGSWQNFVTYTKDQVLVNVYDDGTDIKGTLIDVWAPCWGDEYDVTIISPEVCPEGS